MTAKYNRWDKEREDKFLAALEASGLMQDAIRVCGMSNSAVHKRIGSDVEFAAEVELAHGRYNESLEKEVHRRGFVGWDEPVFGKDGELGTKKRHSDTLALAHLKRRIPAYRDRPIDLNVAKGGVLVVNAPIEDDEVRMEFSGELDPCFIAPARSDDYIALVMPRR